MSKFKAGDRARYGSFPGTVVSDAACMVRFDGKDDKEYPMADRLLTLIPPEPPDYDAEILAAVDMCIAQTSDWWCCPDCSRAGCRVARAINAKRAAQEAE